MNNPKAITPKLRLLRMRRTFAKTGGILAEDYEYFTRQDASTHPNKAAHKLAEQHGQSILKQS